MVMLRYVEIRRLIDLELTGNEIKVYLFGLIAEKFTTDIASEKLNLSNMTIQKCYKNLIKFGLMEIVRKKVQNGFSVEYKFF